MEDLEPTDSSTGGGDALPSSSSLSSSCHQCCHLYFIINWLNFQGKVIRIELIKYIDTIWQSCLAFAVDDRYAQPEPVS